jgi:hypothetical protein
MLNFPFNNPIKKSLSDYIKLSSIISMNKMKERYNTATKEPFKIDYNVNFCDLSDFSSNCESDCDAHRGSSEDDDDHDDDDDNKYIMSKNNKYTRFFVFSLIGTGSIISLSFIFYKIYILYRVYK